MNIGKINNSNTFRGFEITPVAKKIIDETIEKAKNIDTRKQAEKIENFLESERTQAFCKEAGVVFVKLVDKSGEVVKSFAKQLDENSPFMQGMSKYGKKINNFIEELKNK